MNTVNQRQQSNVSRGTNGNVEDKPFIEILGPTPNSGFYRVRMTFYNEKRHFYMNKYGDVIFPKKHDITTLTKDEAAGEKEWFNWAIPKMEKVKFSQEFKQKANKALEQLKKKLEENKLIKKNNLTNEVNGAKLGDISALQNVKAKIERSNGS